MKIKNTFKKTICFLLMLSILALSGCAASEGKPIESKTITYQQYTKQDISYEVPVEMVNNSTFSVSVNSNLSSAVHEMFFESEIYYVLKNSGVQAKSHKETQYGAYKVYEYDATATISGESCAVNVAGIGYNNAVYVFIFIWQDYAEDSEAIYNHFLQSLK